MVPRGREDAPHVATGTFTDLKITLRLWRYCLRIAGDPCYHSTITLRAHRR